MKESFQGEGRREMFPFKVNAEIGEKEMNALNKAVLGSRTVVMSAIMSVMILFAAGTEVFYYSVFKELYFPLLIGIVLFTALLVLELTLPLIARKRSRRELEKNGVSRIAYEFFEESFTDEYENKSTSGRSDQRYSGIIKAVETGEYVFLFPNSTSAFIVPKAEMTQDQTDALREAVKRAITAKKYKIKK